jgi:hypothetical protein
MPTCWPCCYALASHCGGLGSLPGQVMWDLLWTKWKWGMFSPCASVSPTNSHSTNGHVLVFINYSVMDAIWSHIDCLIKFKKKKLKLNKHAEDSLWTWSNNQSLNYLYSFLVQQQREHNSMDASSKFFLLRIDLDRTSLDLGSILDSDVYYKALWMHWYQLEECILL